MAQNKKKVLSLSGRFTICFLAVCILLSMVFSIVFFITGRNHMISNLQSRILDIVSVSRYIVDDNSHTRLLDSKKPDMALYRKIQKNLQHIRDEIDDVYYVYTMTGNDKGEIVFLVDADVNPLTAAKMGQVYESPGPVLKKYFYKMSGPSVEKKIYTDQWGDWMSGYVPLKGGKYSIILGMDISAETIAQYTDKLLIQSFLIFLISLPFILLLGFFIGKTLANPIILMTRAAEKIGRGDFEQRVRIKRKDELGDLTNSLNKMAQHLQDNHEKMEALITKYRGIFDNALEGIFQSSPDGRLITVNKSLVTMAGYDSERDMIETIQNLGSDLYAVKEDRKRFIALMETNKQVTRFRFQVRRKDNTFFWAEMNTHYLSGENLFEGMIVDISERIEAEKAEKDRLEAQASSMAKSEFLANMSHEIRTPLNAVIGLGDLLGRTELSEKQTQYLCKMKSSSQALLALINDILDFSKIEAGHLELEEIPFSLYAVIENLTEMFSHKASEKDIELLVAIEKGIPNALIGDPARLGQILINLTGNALKFTSKGEIVIKIGLGSTKKDDSPVLDFSVKDTGTGIEPSRVDHIFDSFTQEDESVTRRYGGTGLGLTITKQLVEIMGGTISVESQLGFGSTFSFRVCFKSQPMESQLTILPPKDIQGLKVLVVDDNQTARQIISEIIESFGMTVETADSGEQALFLLETTNQTYDLIILDWKMPGLNGIETAKRIKRDINIDQLPIICMVSSYGREDLIHETDRSFLDAFLHKPINPSLLFDSIMEIYGRNLPAKGFLERNPFVNTNLSTVIPQMNGTILLVEDNEINREIAQEWLTQAGLVVHCAKNGSEAIDRLEQDPFDLVLMDIQMPLMDGLEATRILRSQGKFDALPIIAMTAHALKGDRDKGINAGMNDYITKPIDPAFLFKTLATYLKPLPMTVSKKTGSPKEESDFPVTDIDGIDLGVGLFRSNQNARLYEKLLNSFYKDFSDVLETVETLRADNKFDDLKRYFHSIKGVAANLGIQGLSDRAAVLESLTDYSDKEYQAFARETQKVMAGLADFLENTDQERITDLSFPPELPENPLILDAKAFIGILKNVEQELFDDLSLVNHHINKHTHSFKHYVGSQAFERLKSYLSDFALDEAEKQIQIMIDALTPGDHA